MSATERDECQEWLRSLSRWRMVGVRGAGLTASDVVKHLVAPELERHRRRGRGGPEGPAEAGVLEEELGEVEDAVNQHLLLARAALDDGMDVAVERNLDVTALQVGQSVLRAMGHAIRAGRHVTEADAAAYVAARLEKAPPARRSLPRSEFARAYGQVFEARWRAVGEANLRDFPHDEAGLGPDEPPPLVRPGRENQLRGTGRSVYSRYHLAARDDEVVGDAHVVARGEVDRACGRWGLLLEGTFVVLRSLWSGLAHAPMDRGDVHPGAGEFSPEWQREPGPLRESPAEHPLAPSGSHVHGELAAYAQALLATYLRREPSGRLLRVTHRVDEAQDDALRRGWMQCLTEDRRDAQPDAGQAMTIVRIAVFKGIPTGQDLRRKLVPNHPLLDDDTLRTASIGYVARIGTQRSLRLFQGDATEARQYTEAALGGAMLPLDQLLKIGRGLDLPDPEDEEGAEDDQ